MSPSADQRPPADHARDTLEGIDQASQAVARGEIIGRAIVTSG